ncbi:FAD-dependent oxidoreductase [Halobacillus rhizosphaerae]|uniref:NAD(P)/FAD-dependent oxidoreductase n=1 Tax=Halobacillus rhizosphaerae TaxID=3064889 RepID=UPI00398AA49B
MNLQSGSYYWPSTWGSIPDYPSLDQDITCDVLIVGGGSSGAQCAYFLADYHLDVVLIEKQKTGLGSTSTNTCLLQYSGEKMFAELVNIFGDDYVTRHLQLCQEAIDDIEKACSLIDYDSEFTRRDTLYYVSYEKDLERLYKECQWLQQRGAPVEWWTEQEISTNYPFKKRAGMYQKNDAEMNPYTFTHGLLKYAKERGVRIYENTGMTGEHYEKEQSVIQTTTGKRIRAKKVIYAAGYENIEIKPEKKSRFVSTYTVTTKPVEDFSSWYNRTLIWETARPYIYIRTTQDNRIIIGGLDENTDVAEERDSKLLHKRDRLLEEFNELFPDIHVEPEFFSAAFYGGMVDGLPIAAEYKKHPNRYSLLGYGDNGTVYSMLLAKLISKAVAEDRDGDLKLYHQDRPLKKKALYKSS